MANTTGKKYGGRKKGTPNKLTNEVRSVLKDIVHAELETIQDKFDTLEPRERIEFLIKLLPYALPKVANIDSADGEPLQWNNL